MSTQDNTITAQVMNNIDQLYTAHGQGIQPLYDEASGKTPAFTYNNVISAIDNGYLPVPVITFGANNVEYRIIISFNTNSTDYEVYADAEYSANNPDSYLEDGGK